jgi:hypothetical protein
VTWADDRQRLIENRKRSAALARRMARNAEDVAESLEWAARLHDRMAADSAHPLREAATAHAARQREFAAIERDQAARWQAVADESTED